MSAHPAPRATRAIRAETAGSSGLALGPNQRGKGGGEVEASLPVMAGNDHAYWLSRSPDAAGELLLRGLKGVRMRRRPRMALPHALQPVHDRCRNPRLTAWEGPQTDRLPSQFGLRQQYQK